MREGEGVSAAPSPFLLSPAGPGGFQKGLSDWGAQNLDRFQPLLEGGRPLPAGGLALSGSAKQI